MTQRYCINCGLPLGVRIIEGREQQACGTCDFVLWRDPKVVTMAVIESPGGVLLGRRGIEPGLGAWCLPGGFVNHDEAPDVAAVRECREEVRAEVELTGLIGVYHIPKTEAASMVGIAYRARLLSGEHPAPGEEMLEVRIFAPDEMPELVFPSHRAAVHDWRQIGESSLARETR
jgi:8-oxo-dGTP diphosphatase